MKTETKILGAILLVSLIIVIGGVFLLGKNNAPVEKTAFSNIDYSKGQKIGSSSAKVKLAEFSDLQCPACKSVEPFVKEVRGKYQQNLQFIYFHFPLMQHAHSKKAANFAEYAATENKFWEIHDKLFETQENWSSLDDPTDYFAQIGSQFGLDKGKIKEVVSKNSYDQKINDHVVEGEKAGVDATPTFYLNGKKLSLQSFNNLDKEISEELKK
ncbi:thioredoxin domain-containing protein [Candidatus Daviesbacteria bacterium]|nr:thioredoxin domain-containing protein [Candidatus Daviesbacteria bacterium]MBI4038575.1 thioredoxin domain-containing protein [Candidatus Daviesbacteria bacterium]